MTPHTQGLDPRDEKNLIWIFNDGLEADGGGLRSNVGAQLGRLRDGMSVLEVTMGETDPDRVIEAVDRARRIEAILRRVAREHGEVLAALFGPPLPFERASRLHAFKHRAALAVLLARRRGRDVAWLVRLTLGTEDVRQARQAFMAELDRAQVEAEQAFRVAAIEDARARRAARALVD